MVGDWKTEISKVRRRKQEEADVGAKNEAFKYSTW